jgi:hypothetical protein
MKKKLFLFFCGLLVCATINAQSTQHHWISASPGLRLGGLSLVWPAAELRYELMLNPSFSVGAYVYYEFSFGMGITGRWYPFSKSFFLELGSGYNKLYFNNIYFDHDTNKWIEFIEDHNGIDIIPGFGWRIDVGKPGGFYITPSVKFPITFRWYKNPHTPDPHIGSTIIGYFGFGYALLSP